MKKLLIILIFCSNAVFGQEIKIEILNDSIVICSDDTLRISNDFLSCDTISISISAHDTIPVYFIYSDTKAYKIATPPHFTNLQFKVGGTRKEYDNRIFWCSGFIIYDILTNEIIYSDENKKPFPDNILIWDYKIK